MISGKTSVDTGYRVGDAMTHHVLSVSRKASIQECAKIMAENKIGALIVSDARKRPLGIVTERDIVRKGLVDGLKPSQVYAEDVMVSRLVTVRPEEDIFEALRLMRDEDVRHLPVVNEDRVVGIVTVKDLLAMQPALFELWVEYYALEGERRRTVVARGQSAEPKKPK